MKLFDILKTVGGAAISTIVPGAGTLLGLVNKKLPKDAQLPDNATGHQMEAALGTLSADERAELLGKEFDVKITMIKEQSAVLQSVFEHGEKNPHATRPFIAKWSFVTAAVISAAYMAMCGVAVYQKDTATLKALTEGWGLVFAAVSPFMVVVRLYFGDLVATEKNKQDAANGISQPAGIAAVLGGLVKKIGG